ncbi:hypothetical protein NDR87_24705 [Nocardia sp. CDC159]|uniref:YbaB/EbfC DNA-binding family protein n=1 Tax=Nocardia pulmonis TaxID=2951408 RepID=A0A9X2IXX9_9NOCA|nr:MULTISPECIES: hypothetical protein [Nocardia]MCM6775104.1 hypothetical protein [Nocardia pulmonis]MCM6789574.1 hypothetical protein [Nocardia sp. CDC159]
MMAGLDPMQENTRRLVEALTTARSRAQSADGYLVVEACADGEISVRIDDRALVYGGAAVGAELTRLAAQALSMARAGVRDAASTFRADPRISAVLEATEDAMDQPLGQVRQPEIGYRPAPPSGRQQPLHRPVDHDPYDDEDDDPYYRRKSWLVD